MKQYAGWARCPGTCGEWVQGAKDGVPFLIGCPISRYAKAKAKIWLPELKNREVGLDKRIWLWRLPPGKNKTGQALKLFARELKITNFALKIEMDSQLAIGKGMASSTADMVAALGAFSHALGVPWEEEKIARLVLRIEPTDPVMFPQITEIAHQDGSYIKQLGPEIKAKLLMLDWGGMLDTEAFNARADLGEHYRKNEPAIRLALAHFYEGLAKKDLELAAHASTISARCNQEFNPKPEFERFLSWVKAQGGLGVIAAHSGTLLAGIFPVDLPLRAQNNLLWEAKDQFHPQMIEWVETCQGGVEGGVADARR